MRTLVQLLRPFLLLSLIFLSSCGVWDFFAAYFNTYYNAKRLYDEAQEEVWNQPEYRGTGRNLLLPLNVGQATRVKFTSVIEKCSKLLQYHPEANLVDDALLMIGTSYYYQGEYQKAERKFRELLDGYPTSDLVPRTRILLAYGYYNMREFQQASATAAEILEEATKQDRPGIVADISLLLGQIAGDEKNLVQARDAYLRAGENADNADKRAQAYLKAANVLSQLGDYTGAEQAFRRSRSLSSFYVGEYRGLFGAARMQSKQGNYNEALDEFVDLRENANYREFFGEIDVEIGHVHRDHEEIEAAIDQYRYVDTAYARTESATNANYALGIVYEDSLHLYDSARVAFDRGRLGPPQALVMPEVVRRADYLGRYLKYSHEVVKLDSTLAALLAPRDSTSTPIDTTIHDSTKTAVRDSTLKPAPPVPRLEPDTVRVRLATALDDLAGVLYTNMGLPDSARYWYERLLHEFPNSRPAPRALYVLARIEGEDSTAGPMVADSLHREIIRRYPASPFADEARRLLGLPAVQKAEDPAIKSYGRASALLDAGRSQIAIDSFKAVARRFPGSPVASRALYAAGWTYEYRTKNIDSATAAYERLLATYPSSPLALKVQPRINEVMVARRIALEKARADSIASATPPAAVDSTRSVESSDDIERRFEERRKAAQQQPDKPATIRGEPPPGKPATGPAEQPPGKPATRPTEQPPGKPATGPAEQPPGKPATGPAEQPPGKPSTGPSEQPPVPPPGTPEEKPVN